MGKSLVKNVLDNQRKAYKISLLSFALVAMPFFVFLLSSLVNAQVIIKEKVEINPQNNILPEYPQSNLDPCLSIHRPPYYQSVYSCSSYPVEPYQQNYPWQAYYNYGMQLDSATIYNLEIISGSEYAYFYKVGHWDTTTHAPVDEEYIGSTLNGLTGVELAGWGRYEAFHWSGTFEREHWSYYHIRYQNFSENEVDVIYRITNTSTNENTEWHTTIVNPQYTMQNLGIDGDTVLHNRALIVTPNIHNSLVLTCLQFGYGSCPPTNVTFSIEMLEGMEYGNIGRYNDFLEEFEYAPSFTGLSFDEFAFGFYNFNANGLQPDSTAVVRIRQSSSDADIGSFEYTLYIKRNFLPPVSENGSIVIETNKNTAMPGDTIDILLKWEDGANGIVDFSDWQEFSVWLADGFSYGTLLNTATGDTSDAFDVIGKELKFVVHQNVTDVNKKIVIAAETVVAVLGGNRMMQNNLQPKNETKSTVKKNLNNYRTLEQGGFVKAKDKNKNDKEDKVDDGEINIDFVVSEVYLSGIKEITINPFIVEIHPPTVSAGDTARIIPKYMDSTGNYVEFDSLQTFELGILDGCPLGYLSADADSNQYFYGVTQPFYFIADSSADTGVVSIRVGVIEMNQQNRSLTNNKNNTPESDNPVSCANVSFVENFYANGEVVLEDCACKKWECKGEVKRPKFDVLEINLGNGTQTEKDYIESSCCSTTRPKYGFFHPIFEGPFYEPKKTGWPCFDCNENLWKFDYSMDTIFLRAYTVFCTSCRPDAGIIRSLNDVWDKIPEDQLCNALADFKLQKKYKVKVDFIIKEGVLAHERVHKNDFFTALAKTLFNYPLNNDRKYNESLLNSNINCQKASNDEIASKKIIDYLDIQYEEFEDDLETNFNAITYEEGTPENYEYESVKTHGNPLVQEILDQYIKELEKRINKINKNRSKENKIVCN